jgi:hypothetical protein
MIGQPLTRLNFVFRPMRDPLAKGFPSLEFLFAAGLLVAAIIYWLVG